MFIIRRIKQKTDIKSRILTALEKHLENIEGIYLYGSQARGEADKSSDIDLLIITNKKLSIKVKGFEIICLQQNEIDEAIKIAPIIIYSALSEAKPIMNASLLERLKHKYRLEPIAFVDYIKETEEIVKINEKLLDPYSVILRLRGIYITACLLDNRLYFKKAFLSWLKKKCPDSNVNGAYSDYINSKRNNKVRVQASDKDINSLLFLLKSETGLLKDKIHGKKRKKT